MNKLLPYLTFLFISISVLTNAQNSYLDSLKNELNKENLSSNKKFKLYNQLSEFNRTTDNYKQADFYINQQIKLAKKEENKLELVKAYTQRGIIYDNQQAYDKTQKSLDTIQNIVKDLPDFLPKVYHKFLIAYHQIALGDFESSTKTVQAFLSRLEETPNEFVLKSKSNYLLYAAHATWNDAKNATIYAEKSLKYAEESGDKNLLVSAYTTLAVAQSLIYSETENAKDLKLLIDTSKKAIEVRSKYPNQVSTYNYAVALLNMSNYYLNFTNLSAKIQEEIKQNCFEVIELCKTIPHTQNTVASALGILSNLAMKNNDYALAEQYLLNANETLLTQKPLSYYTLLSVAGDLATVYNRHGDYKKAFEFQKKATEYTDLLYNQTQAEATKKLEAEFQSKQKEAELNSLKAKANSLKKERLLYIFLGVAGIIGAFFMFRSYHYKLRYSIGRENQLNAEKHEAAIQLKLQNEEQARMQAEQELMSLRQQKLQDEVLASQLHLEHKNNVLKNLKNKLGNETSVDIKRVIKEESLLDNDLEKTQFRIQELHPNFFKNLSDHTKQKLTPLDLKYCSYIYLGMDTKQIATILNVEPKSVRMTKYRLKQKFGLTKDDELNTFFHQIIS